MIVAVAATKGGSGKTTRAVGLTEALAARGDVVVLVDPGGLARLDAAHVVLGTPHADPDVTSAERGPLTCAGSPVSLPPPAARPSWWPSP